MVDSGDAGVSSWGATLTCEKRHPQRRSQRFDEIWPAQTTGNHSSPNYVEEQEQLADHDHRHGLFLTPPWRSLQGPGPGVAFAWGLDLYVIPFGSFKNNRAPQHTFEF